MKLKYMEEYLVCELDSTRVLTKNEEILINNLKINEDGLYSLDNLNKTAKKLNKNKFAVKHQFTRLLTKKILRPINESFAGEGVYLIKVAKDVYKIGYALNVRKRLKVLQRTLFEMELVAIYAKPQYLSRGVFELSARSIEKMFKDKFVEFNAKKEVFDKSEYYRLNQKNYNKALNELDDLLLVWAMSYNLLGIDKKNGREFYKPVRKKCAEKAIKFCRIFN